MSAHRFLALAAALLLASAGIPAGDEGARDEARLRRAAQLRGQALAEMGAGNYGRAREHLEELECLLPENLLPPLNLAICHLRLGDPEAALAQVERARELAPGHPGVLYTLARILEEDPALEARRLEVLRRFAELHPEDPRPHYLEALALELRRRPAEAVVPLERALEREAENVVVLGDLLVAAAAAGDLEKVEDALDGLEDRFDGFEGDLEDYAERLRDLVDAGVDEATVEAAVETTVEAARPMAVVVRNLLRPTELYQVHLVPFLGSRQAGGGALFPQQDFVPALPKCIQGGEDLEITFEPAPELAAGPLPAPAADLELGFDVDQDGLGDRVEAEPAKGVRLFPGREGGGFGAARLLFEARPDERWVGLFPLDVDHDGDLDLLVGREGAADLYLQNGGPGPWLERGAEVGLADPDDAERRQAGATGAAVADLDDDGDLDLAVARRSGSPGLYLNQRTGRLETAAEGWGLAGLGPGLGAVRAADLDGDGRFDLLFWGEAGGVALLSRPGRFEPLPLPGDLAGPWRAAAVADLDNDGDLDLAVALGGGSLFFVRNREGRLEVAAEITVPDLSTGDLAATDLEAVDLDDDGDLDLAARLASGERRAWRNRGSERNHWLRLGLVGKNDNNSKNNTQGLFCRIEVRAGDHYQAVLGNGGVNHLGLGAHRQADVVRVVWTNGVAQTWQLVAAGQTLVEEQVLKGSCPFLYTWDGEGFTFVTDLMWKSALGMLLADGSPAPHQSARDFVLIPGEALRPAGGELWLQVTEELWETAYVDRQQLLAVDHPAEVELVVDERFTLPPHAREAPIHWIGERLAPSEARDHEGRDVLAAVVARDGRHVDRLPLDRYQGLTRGHALELVFRGLPEGERARLLLWGWTFPTDTSINFALTQDASRRSEPPRLELLGEDGRWRLLEACIGFPNGKRKAVVVELGERLPAGEARLRIATNMQVYWDAAALALGEPALGPGRRPVITRLEPRRAELHYRGYSRLYRESPSGPHLFDYQRVAVGPRFRDMTGAFTRYGRVEELLADEDDRYVVMNAGDEMTVVYGAEDLPPLPPGWRRDYVLYTDGWVKDADLNTVHGQTVAPLPYHGMAAYPDRPEHRYPETEAHRRCLETYQTRHLDGRPFRDALKATQRDSQEDQP